MITMPTVSVVMAVHNGALHVREAVESILQQTINKLEFIVVDDASTDTTLEILEGYRACDGRLKVLVNDVNLGLATSLNRALAVSRGEFVARMDADDWCYPNRLEAQVTFLRAHADIALVGSHVLMIDDSGRELGVMVLPSKPEILRKIARFRTVAFHPTWVCRRTVMSELGGYRDFPVSQDYDLLLRLLDAGHSVSNYPGVLCKYRMHTGVSHRKALTVRKTTNYILCLRRERRRRGGSDSYSRAAAYARARSSAAGLFFHRRAHAVFHHARALRERGHAVRAILLYGLSGLLSVYQLQVLLRLAAAMIIRATARSHGQSLYEE